MLSKLLFTVGINDICFRFVIGSESSDFRKNKLKIGRKIKTAQFK